MIIIRTERYIRYSTQYSTQYSTVRTEICYMEMYCMILPELFSKRVSIGIGMEVQNVHQCIRRSIQKIYFYLAKAVIQ